LALAPGTRLGVYEVTAQIGEGGMGEVYRARDTKLNRDIAIKVLPEAFAQDADRLARFEREAQAIAALNHPSIVTIYSVEQVDGHVFLTMELVEGRSLAEALLKAGLSLDRLLKIAIPVADAMATAHQKSITHRDLKPANIMLGEGEQAGRVKVLDFGLAKLSEVPAGGVTTLPTAPLTGEGRILGTVAYMSPEQAEGKAVDSRSDLFSLGVILYEMATGQRPFTGETSMSIISSILKDTPASVTELNPTLPRDLGRIIRRALVKDPTRRYQTAADLRNDLEEVKASLESGELLAPTTSGVLPHHGGGPVPRHRGLAVVAGIVALTLAGGIYALRLRRAQPAASTSATLVVSLQDLQITQLTTSGNAITPAISPDGKYVAYVQQEGDSSSLWIRQIATSSNVRVLPPEAGVSLLSPTVTPDGSFLDFIRFQGGPRAAALPLWRVPFLGGTPKRLVENVASPIGWSPDGRQMAFIRADAAVNSSALVIADADGGRQRVLSTRRTPAQFVSTLTVESSASRPAWSPDGRVIAIFGGNGGSRAQVVFVDVGTGSEVVLDSRGSFVPFGIGWLDAATVLLSQPAEIGSPVQLWRMSYPDGAVSRLTNDVNSYHGVGLDGDRHNVVTSRSEKKVAIWEGDGAARSGEEVVPPTPVVIQYVRVAWAGERLLYDTIANGRLSIASILPRGTITPVEVASNGYAAVGTSDGKTIVFMKNDEKASIWKVDADGRQPVELVSASGLVPTISRDDRHVIYHSVGGGLQGLWRVPIEGGEPTEIPRTNAVPGSVDVSPDGGRLLFVSSEAQNQFMFVVCELPACTNRRNLARPANFRPPLTRWTPDGRAIAYVDGTASNIWSVPLEGGPPHQITHFTDRTIAWFAWSHDGKRLAIARTTTTNDIVLFKGLNR
jgi:serine/threonine protein kinase/Tol biopolymer transport system component